MMLKRVDQILTMSWGLIFHSNIIRKFIDFLSQKNFVNKWLLDENFWRSQKDLYRKRSYEDLLLFSSFFLQKSSWDRSKKINKFLIEFEISKISFTSKKDLMTIWRFFLWVTNFRPSLQTFTLTQKNY